MKRAVLVMTAVLAIVVGIVFVYRPALAPIETPKETESIPQAEVLPVTPAQPIVIAVTDVHKVPKVTSKDGTLVGEFGPLFPPGTVYEILKIEDIVYEGIAMKEAHIYLPKQSKILATADGTVSLSEEGGAAGLVVSKIVVVVATGYDSQIFVKHNALAHRGDELMLSNGPCPEDKNATVLVVFYPHGLGKASKEEREKAMNDFLELLKLGSQPSGGS